VNSFLFVNLLRFQQVNATKTLSINSNIYSLKIANSYNFELDSNLLNPLVFEKLNQLYCFATIKSIQTDLFAQFNELAQIEFLLNSLGNFYHQVGIEWLTYINSSGHHHQSAANSKGLQSATRKPHSSGNLTIISRYTPYLYPDKDFCIFAKYPNHKKLIIILSDPCQNGETFTFAWLCKNGAMLKSGRNISNCHNWNVSNDRINDFLNACNVQQRDPITYDSYSDFYQTRLIDILLMELIPFVCIPCACLIGLFLNWKIIQTIKKN
jgi:hypothetical protein